MKIKEISSGAFTDKSLLILWILFIWEDQHVSEMEEFEYLQWISKISALKNLHFHPLHMLHLFIYKSTKLSTIPNNFRPTTSTPLAYLLSALPEGYLGSIPMNWLRSCCLAKLFPNFPVLEGFLFWILYLIFIALRGLFLLFLFIFDGDDLLTIFLF